MVSIKVNVSDMQSIAPNGPAIKLVGVAERMEVVTTKLSLSQGPGTQPE